MYKIATDWNKTLDDRDYARYELQQRADKGDAAASRWFDKFNKEQNKRFGVKRLDTDDADNESNGNPDEDLDDDDWEAREQDWMENGAGYEPDDYVDAPGEESLGWDAAEGRYYGP